MEHYTTFDYEVSDHIGLLTLNRPQVVNAINEAMTRELTEFWAARRQDLETRVIVLTGAGERGFCSGLDLKEAASGRIFGDNPTYDMARFYQVQAAISRLVLAMRQAPQPIIAAVFGAAMGGGFSFALGADVRVIAPDTQLVAQYINIGLGGADVGSSYFLPRLIGAGRAYEFLLTGDVMDAETALGLGLVSRVVAKDRLLDEAMAMAGRMCRHNPLGLRLTKEAINCNLDATGLEQALNLEDRNQSLCFAGLRYEGQPQGDGR